MRHAAVALVVALGLAPAPAGAADEAAVREQVRRVLGVVAGLRDLPAEAPVKVEVAGKEKILGYLRRTLEKQGEIERLTAQGRLWVRLGMHPPTDDFIGEVLELLTSQVAGYYDPERATFIVADWIPASLQEPVMAHELVHALQDQHFDLEALMKPTPDNEDQGLAVSALLEGDALAITLDYALRDTGRTFLDMGDPVALVNLGMVTSGPGALPQGTAEVLKEVLLFPYSYGTAFIQYGRRRGPWHDVDAAYAAPPTSTEQVLLPGRYWDERDEPRPVDLEELVRREKLPAGTRGSTQGQFLIYLWLEGMVERDEAVAASVGWDGDRFALHGEPGRETVVFSTVWDSVADAREFARILAHGLGASSPPERDGALAPFPSTLGRVSLALRGDTVSGVIAPPAP